MNFVELFCSTQGRVGRGTYWTCFGIWLLVSAALRGSVSLVASFTGDERVVAVFFWAWVAFGMVTYFPMTALLVKRLHDSGRSGYWAAIQHLFLFSILMIVMSAARMSGGSLLIWVLLMLLCSLGSLLVLWFTLRDGDDGSNEYGMPA